MSNALTRTDFSFKGQKSVYHGKVRDVYNIDDDLMVMVATDRISAFDVILKNKVTDKGKDHQVDVGVRGIQTSAPQQQTQQDGNGKGNPSRCKFTLKSSCKVHFINLHLYPSGNISFRIESSSHWQMTEPRLPPY